MDLLYILGIILLVYLLSGNKNTRQQQKRKMMYIEKLNPTKKFIVDYIKRKPKLLLVFLAGYCGHCETLKKSGVLGQMSKYVDVLAVDVAQQTSILKYFNVKGFPTIRLYSNDTFTEFNENRTLANLKRFVGVS